MMRPIECRRLRAYRPTERWAASGGGADKGRKTGIGAGNTCEAFQSAKILNKKMPSIKRKRDRVAYYAKNILLDSIPSIFFRRNLEGFLEKSLRLDSEYIVDRVNFYNEINSEINISMNAKQICHIPMNKSMYYYDFKEMSRYFSRNLLVNFEFGDIKDFPEEVTFLKSRPIGVDHRNGILVKINKFRHYYMPRDARSFFDKKPIAVWRGGSHNPKRIALVSRHKDNPICDVALTAGEVDADASKFLAPVQQMAFRYVICIEGNDLASNLVRTMASNSLCLMPRPTNESWFMESRLVPGRHYVELDENFEDLEDTILYYERHPGEAQEIVRNANRHVGQFLDARRERAIGLLVMYKYFIATRQIEPDETIAELIWP